MKMQIFQTQWSSLFNQLVQQSCAYAVPSCFGNSVQVENIAKSSRFKSTVPRWDSPHNHAAGANYCSVVFCHSSNKIIGWNCFRKIFPQRSFYDFSLIIVRMIVEFIQELGSKVNQNLNIVDIGTAIMDCMTFNFHCSFPLVDRSGLRPSPLSWP